MTDEENTLNDLQSGARGEPPSGDLPRASLEAEGTTGSGRMRRGPFLTGFLLTLGGLIAFQLGMAALRLSQVWVLILVSMFLALGLNPLVEWLCRRGLRRGGAIAVVFVGFIALFALFVGALVPPLVEQGTAFVDNAPKFIDQLGNNELVRRLDEQFGILDQLQKLASANMATQVFGGLLGVGRAVVSALFSALTILVLTLYFLGSLPSIKNAAYKLVPSSRRARVRHLGDQVIQTVGGFVAGQTTVASIAGVTTYVFLFVLSKIMEAPLLGEYSLALALVVALFDLVPLVGAIAGAVVVSIVGLADSVTAAVICAAFYTVYQQIENYVVAPRIMRRSLNLDPMITIISALIGGTLFGVVGALVAIPMGAAAVIIYREVVVPRQDAA
jgi:predicted PurR-regulated permease PerM